MMNHDEIREKLFDLYDRPLTKRERMMVENHLPDCPECRLAFEQWQRISQTLFTLPSPSEAEEDRFVAKVMGRVQKPRYLAWLSGMKWAMPLVGSALTALWVFAVVLPNNPELVQPPLTLSLLNSAHVESKAASKPVLHAARPTRPIPALRYDPISQNAAAFRPIYRPVQSVDYETPNDPFVQAVVLNY